MKNFFLYLMAGAYILAGTNHFLHPQINLAIMPPWLPAHKEMVLLSGVVEILLGVFLFLSKTRRAAAWGIIFLLLAVFPANVQMFLNWQGEVNPNVWMAVLRLPLQILLIGWAFLYTRQARKKKTE